MVKKNKPAKKEIVGSAADISERKRTEEALALSEEKFRLLVENSHDIIYTLTPEGVFTFVSPAWTVLLGHPVNEVAGHAFQPFVHPDDIQGCMMWLQKVVETGQRQEGVEYRVRHVDGSWRWHTSSAVPLRDAAGTIVGFEGTARDISERKKAEEALRKVSDRLSLATRAGGVGIWDFDTVNNVLVWDDVMLRLYGVTADNFGGAYEAWRKGLHPEDLQRGDAEIQMALRGEKEFDTEFRVIWPDGTIRNIRALAIVQRDASGKPTHMIGTNWDITELKQAEEALRESEERYRIILEQMHEGYYEVDLSGNYTFVNDASCRNLGYSREELIGNSFQIALSENEAKAVFQAYHEVYLSGEPNKGFIFEVLRKDGTVGFAESSITLLKNNRGEPVGFRSVGRDITERKQMQQKLEEIATHDFLTGLPNRVLLLDRFTIAAAMAHRNKVRLAVMSLDLDKFKSINDTLGHAAGDEVLKTVSTRLTGIIRASDTLARIGGDEFILVMMESNHINDASAIAQKILDAFVEPMLIDGRPVHLSTSIGIAIYPEDAEDMETLIKESDAAMYYSKGHGRNQFKFFGDGDVRISGDHKSAPN